MPAHLSPESRGDYADRLAAVEFQLRSELQTVAEMDDGTELFLRRERYAAVLGAQFSDDELNSLADAISDQNRLVHDYWTKASEAGEDHETIRAEFYTAAADEWLEKNWHV